MNELTASEGVLNKYKTKIETFEDRMELLAKQTRLVN